MVAAVQKHAFPWQVVLVALPVLLLLGASGWMAKESARRSIEFSDRVTHTHRVIGEVKEASALLHEAESSQRTFVLTGAAAESERFPKVVERFEQHFSRVRELTNDNPRQRLAIERLDQLIRARVALLEKTMGQRRKGDVAGATALIRSNRGSDLMELVRIGFRDVEAEEARLLEERSALELNETYSSQRWNLLTTLLGAIALLLGTVVVGRGVNERRRALEESLEAREMALKALAARSQFLANMSHEIRTPLHSIIGMAEVLADRPEEMEADRGLSIIRRAGNLLMNLINDILDLSKIEAGKLDIDHVPFDLHAHVDETVSMIAFRASQKGLDLTADIGRGVPTVVVGDPNRMRQILLNLIGNAIKFTSEGKVSVVVSSQPPNGATSGAWPVVFDVSDTGIGIPEHQHHLVFEKFRRLDSSASRSYGGTGLGLTISKQLVELMHGKISFTSQAGVGTTFRVELPLEIKSDVVVERQEKIWQADRRRLRILIVDDVEDNRLIAQLYLKHLPYRLEFAQNGLEAIDRVARARPDLVIIDMHMPKMSGYDAVKEIRRREAVERMRPIPIIALTASALREDADRSLAAGCNAHLTKPITRERLQRAILDATAELAAKEDAPAESSGTETIYLKRGLQALIPPFQANCARDLEELVAASGRNDFAKVAELAHTLKGVTGTFGFHAVSKIVAEAEALARAGEAERVATLAREARDLFARIRVVYI